MAVNPELSGGSTDVARYLDPEDGGLGAWAGCVDL